MLGALILLALIQLPLAWRLGRRLRESQRERLNLLQRAVDASELERRRIAGDLHDGVVQNLAGVSYALSAAANSAPPELASTLVTLRTRRGRGSGSCEACSSRSIRRSCNERAWRPPSATCSRLRFARIGNTPSRRGRRRAAAGGSTLLPRRPGGLRNVVKHSGAHSVEVEVARQNGRGVLRVTDDGDGFDPELRPEGAHFGLRLLRDLVRDAGGDFEIDSTPGRGTSLRVEVAL